MNWASWTTTRILTGHAGVCTDEAGVLRGEVDVHTTWADGQAIVTAQFSGSADWYTVTGSPVPCATEHESRDLHQRIVDGARSSEKPLTLGLV
ncbi:hypothetical protein KDL01_16465 [Actinospica durhamensis]|uniref:Uncharacterized protein n=1 Tax=Actinospica durhamensis TaxID=1508375 RepID=A0A941ISG5_9ACTN|nr:hypothetical protein [Actinospica durhamensis]MBR7834868.1 hypothetical protein [Actinospica durhamensis]